MGLYGKAPMMFGCNLHFLVPVFINIERHVKYFGTYGTYYLDPAGPGVCFHPHNITLQLLSETGIVGFYFFFTMVISLAICFLRTYFKKKLWLIYIF